MYELLDLFKFFLLKVPINDNLLLYFSTAAPTHNILTMPLALSIIYLDEF